MATALFEVGKTIDESDLEVSEAIDLLRFYAITAEEMNRLESIDATPRGPVVVLSPWNFPIAIPCGGIAAALATGNCVILKPSPPAAATALRLCQIFWESGISQSTLQFVTCLGSEASTHLVGDRSIDSVILTGGTKTAENILRRHPHVRLFAETGGKNSTIISAVSDRDLAIKHVAYSAFGFSGQKCSATSLLILEAEVYDDPQFKSALIDAVSSLPVGSAWQAETFIGPLIDPPKNDLKKAVHLLDDNENWALEPGIDPGNPRLVSPGIRWDVLPGSYSHQTEFFGPILSVLRADDLQHAIQIANATPYGLTAGLESLDDREQETWTKEIVAGNLYVNRPTTGAIVLRQPFGGFGKSCFGPGFKAGGPHYVNLFMQFTNKTTALENAALMNGPLKHFGNWLRGLEEKGMISKDTNQQLGPALRSYEKYFSEEYGTTHDHFLLVGQDNIRRYLSIVGLTVRIEAEDTDAETLLRIACAHLTSSPFTISYSPQIPDHLKQIVSMLPHGIPNESPSAQWTRLSLLKRCRPASVPGCDTLPPVTQPQNSGRLHMIAMRF